MFLRSLESGRGWNSTRRLGCYGLAIQFLAPDSISVYEEAALEKEN